MTPSLSLFDQNYLRMGLHIDKHVPGYVDAYIGPAAIKEAVAAEAQRAPVQLLKDVQKLQEQIPGDNAQRAAYLAASLRAMEGTLRLLNGQTFPYLEEVQWLYDVSPSLTDEGLFEAAHEELELLLPGYDDLPLRMEEYRRRYELRVDQILPLLEKARRETRQRTRVIVDLVEGEDLEVRLTREQPWGAYNWYLGNGQSLIEFNTDVPVSALGILGTFAHEGYPGHHTEAQLKEQHLYREKGYGEQAIFLLHSPAAVIAEGIASTAIEIIFPDESWHEWNANVLLPEAGIAGFDTAEQMNRISLATRALRYTTPNAAILYHTGELDEEETVAYIQQFGLTNRLRAEKSFSFISSPLFRSYIFTYTQGYDLIENAVAGGDKTALFRRLLTEQILPSQLEEWHTDGLYTQ